MSDNHDAAAAAAADVPPLTTMASAMFFGTILFTTVALACLVSFGSSSSSSSHNTNSNGSSGSSSLLVQAATNKRSYPLDGRSLLSIYTLLHHTSLFGFILLYAYICENHPPYPHAEKTYDRDEFFFLTFLVIFVSLFTLKSHANKNSNTPPAANATSSNGSSSNGSSSNGSSSNGSKSHSNGSVVELKKKLTNIVDDENGSIEMNGLLNEDHNLDDSKNKSAAVVVAVAAVVAPVNDLTDVLNRDQTEEWKGWMQFMFLLYHYHHAEEVYNAIRIMITCYVFMTGFGNVSFFYLKADYSAVRVLQMLWRLNFLVVFLCLTQGTTYILYYICLLHTYFFLMVYVTMRVAKHVNYDKWGIRIKLFLLACIIFIVWDVDSGIFQAVHWPFLNDSRPMLGATGGAMWEWYFRSTLDHWSTFIGMIFALNFPITSLFFRKAEAQPWLQHVAVKSLVGSAFLVATYLWTTGPFQQGKFDYNQTNAYYGCIPLMAYIYFRNLTPWLRSHYLDLLHQIGKTTLETYLMQHHIWLTSNAKSLLVIIPGWPKVNFLLVTILYVAASRRLYSLTLFLRGMLLPDDTYICLRNLAGMACTLMFCVAVAFVLQLMRCLNLVTVAMISIGFGYLLFQFIVSRTWAAFVASAGGRDGSSSSSQQQSDHHISRGTAVRISNSKRLAMSMGIAAVLVTGTVWHAMARTGAAKIQPLSASCQDYVQQGSWIQTDVCTEESRGQAERDYGISALGTCTPQSQSGSVWGWKSSPTSSHCRLTQRDASSLLKTIKHRNITFVGDSVLRHLYHSMCRQVGDASAGAYNTTMEKWSDYTRRYGKDTYLEFRWAPYTNDTLVSTLARIIEDESSGDDTSHKPDLVVVGGGPWDLLHRYRTPEERQSLETGVQKLAQEMEVLRASGIPVVWVVPTTINTWGLLTDAKRDAMREDQMEPLRALYEKNGVLKAASFVLDGRSFTKERVTESYDGVHYPLAVYDAGAQILANSLDWLLPVPTKPIVDPFTPPQPGKMANPCLGVMVLLFVVVGLFFMDGFMGFTYFAACIVPSLAPSALYEEAFTALHQAKRLPLPVSNGPFPGPSPCFSSSSPSRKSSPSVNNKKMRNSSSGMSDDELDAFLQKSDDESPGTIALVASGSS